MAIRPPSSENSVRQWIDDVQRANSGSPPTSDPPGPSRSLAAPKRPPHSPITLKELERTLQKAQEARRLIESWPQAKSPKRTADYVKRLETMSGYVATKIALAETLKSHKAYQDLFDFHRFLQDKIAEHSASSTPGASSEEGSNSSLTKSSLQEIPVDVETQDSDETESLYSAQSGKTSSTQNRPVTQITTQAAHDSLASTLQVTSLKVEPQAPEPNWFMRRLRAVLGTPEAPKTSTAPAPRPEDKIRARILELQAQYIQRDHHTDEDALLLAMEDMVYKELQTNPEKPLSIEFILKNFKTTPEAQLEKLETIHQAFSRYEQSLQIDHQREMLTESKALYDLQKAIQTQVLHNENIQGKKDYEDALQLLNRLLDREQKKPLSIQELFRFIAHLRKLEALIKPEHPIPAQRELLIILDSEPVKTLIKLQTNFKTLLKYKTHLTTRRLQYLKELYSAHHNLFKETSKTCKTSIQETNEKLVEAIQKKRTLKLDIDSETHGRTPDQRKIESLQKELEIEERKIKLLDTNYRIAIQRFQKAYRDFTRKTEQLKALIHGLSTKEWLKDFLFPEDFESELYHLELTHQFAMNGLNGVRESGLYLWETLRKMVQDNESLTDVNKAGTIGALKQVLSNALTVQTQDGYINAATTIISNLFDWANKHPLAAQRFTGSLQRITAILQRSNPAFIGWQQGTSEAQIRDTFQGNRAYLSAAQETEVMPPEMAFLLYVIDKTPEPLQVLVSCPSQAASSALVIDNLSDIPKATAIGGILGTVLGFFTSKISSGIARKVTQNRNTELTASAILDGIAYDGTFLEKLHASADYVSSREITVQIGNALTDRREKGFFRNFASTLKYWWNESNRSEKARRFVLQGGPLVVGATVLGVAIYSIASVATFGALPIATAVIGGIITAGAILWGAFKAYSTGKLSCDSRYAQTRRKVEDLLTQDRLKRIQARILTQQKHTQLQEIFDIEQNEGIFATLTDTQTKAAWLKQQFQNLQRQLRAVPEKPSFGAVFEKSYQQQLDQFNQDLGFPPDWADKADDNFWKSQANQFESELKAKREKPKAP